MFWLCVCITVHKGGYMCVCACANTHLHMPFVVVCMCVHVYRVHVFVLTRACALNMAVALGSQDRALFALLTQGASYKLLTLPHLLISLPSISPPTHTHTEPHRHHNTQILKRNRAMFPSAEPCVKQKNSREERRRPADRTLSRYSCLSCCSFCASHL